MSSPSHSGGHSPAPSTSPAPRHSRRSSLGSRTIAMGDRNARTLRPTVRHVPMYRAQFTPICGETCRDDPPDKLPFECQKIAKNLTFFSKNLTKFFIFFNKIAKCQKLNIFFNKIVKNWQFCWKKWKILSNFLKKLSSFWQFFVIQMAIIRRVRCRDFKGLV